jgi:hypothetical protein
MSRVSRGKSMKGKVESEMRITGQKRERGESRTGPALNPLKGSSARLPHQLLGCKPYAITKSFIFSELASEFRVKKLYLPGKITCPSDRRQKLVG